MKIPIKYEKDWDGKITASLTLVGSADSEEEALKDMKAALQAIIDKI